MKATLYLLILVFCFSALSCADDTAEIREAATSASKALSERKWGAIYDGWCDRLQFVSSWEAFFEANLAIEAKQQWKEEAEAILLKYYKKAEADRALGETLRENSKLPDDDRIRLLMNHVTDRKALWIEWTKVRTKDSEVTAPHDFGKATVEFLDGFAKLSDGKIVMYFKKEDERWKVTVRDIEPDLQESKVEAGGGQPAIRPESK